MECKFAQRERSKGVEKLRCVNKSCDSFLELVGPDICSGCPFKQSKVKKKRDRCTNCPDEIKQPAIAEKEKLFESMESLQTATPEDNKDFPPVATQLWNYQNALRRWQNAGRPVRSAEEVETILEIHCKGCDWYDKDRERCKGCGCKVTTGSMAIFNKIKMATEHCPQELW